MMALLRPLRPPTTSSPVLRSTLSTALSSRARSGDKKLSWCTDSVRWDEAFLYPRRIKTLFMQPSYALELKVSAPFFRNKADEQCCSTTWTTAAERKTSASAFSTRMTPAPINAPIVFGLPPVLRHRSSLTHARICFSGQWQP